LKLEGALDGALLSPFGSRASVRSAVKYILNTTPRGLSPSEVPN
jgi:hypothetical protein